MFKAEKVLWGEGLFLRPQHFQIQDTYHEQRLNHTVRAVVPFSYGVQKLSFDEAQLSTHILALESVEMIWQDGEIYQAPAYDLLPGEFKHEVRQFQKPYDNQQAEQISLMV